MAVTGVLVRHGESQWTKKTVSPVGTTWICLEKGVRRKKQQVSC
ncbi:hypothetical protein OIU92_08255 [Escherichia coli]|nr:hypothetical protein [Escherichia coli]